MYSPEIPKLRGDIIVPKYNVATLGKSALVIEGVRYAYTLNVCFELSNLFFCFCAADRDMLY